MVMRSAADGRRMVDQFESCVAGARVRGNDPAAAMRETGLIGPVPDYAGIARTQAVFAGRTGRLGLAGVWGDPRRVGRRFLGCGTDAHRAESLGRSLAVALSEPPAAIRSAKFPR